MANDINWGQGAVNNNIGWGQGASNNSISWGLSQKDSYSGETEIYGIRTDADVLAFYSKVTTAGGILTTTEQTAINQLVVDLKAKGLWTSMKAIYPMVGSSAASCAQNLVSSSFTGTFNGAWTFSSNGVIGNATNTFFNTGLNQSTNLNASNNHISIYSRTNSNILQIDSGITDGATYSFNQFFLRFNGNVIYENGSQVINVATGNSLGLYIGTSTSTTLAKLYKNNSILGSSTTTQSKALFNRNIYIGASNSNGTTSSPTNRQYAFASIGDGLNDTQASDFYTIVQAFNTTLSRQV